MAFRAELTTGRGEVQIDKTIEFFGRFPRKWKSITIFIKQFENLQYMKSEKLPQKTRTRPK